ncbi:MAG TPA: branched-chain amino acid ABC transporter substrate-binding protein [Firmicutes bacterium]|nr:branched-chain amino acid ABC transporter substrate-binding protein [Bacillota bacterium]
MKRVVIVTLVLALAVSLGACAGKPAEKPTVKIGVQEALTGDWAYEGQGILNAVQMLADQVNQAGGLLDGRQVEIIPGDNKSDAKESALSAQKLINSGVVAVIGSYGSTVTEAAQKLYDEKGIVHVATASTAVRLTEHGFKRFFRVCPSDDKQSYTAADLIVKGLGYKKVAVVHDNTTYAKGLADWTKKYLEEMGATVVLFDALTPKEKDYGAILTKVKNAQPEVFFYAGYYPEAALLLRQMVDIGLKVPLVTDDAANNPELVRLAGVEFAKGTLIVTPPQPADLQYPEAKKFMDDFKAKYGKAPESIWHCMGADAFRVIVEAVKKTNSDDPAKIADYLHQELKDFPGVTGPIPGFDEKGERTGSAYHVYVVNDKGEIVPYTK